MKNCLQWRHLREKLKEATFMFLNELASILVEWHMVSESADFLLKTSVFFMWKTFGVADVENECVRDSCEESDVAKFGRSAFSLIENEDDLDSAMRREIDFHLREYEGVMS